MQVTSPLNVHARPFLSTHETNLIGGRPRQPGESRHQQARAQGTKLRVLLTNAFGLQSKLGEFQHTLRRSQADIAIVTETKFTPEKVTEAEGTIPGYTPPIRQDRVGILIGIALRPLRSTSTATFCTHPGLQQLTVCEIKAIQQLPVLLG